MYSNISNIYTLIYTITSEIWIKILLTTVILLFIVEIVICYKPVLETKYVII